MEEGTKTKEIDLISSACKSPGGLNSQGKSVISITWRARRSTNDYPTRDFN